MHPTSKSKTKNAQRESYTRKLVMGDTDEAIGGYDPTIRQMLTKVERRGGKFRWEKKSGQDLTDESTNTDSDEDSL